MSYGGTTLTTTASLNALYYDKKFLEAATAKTVYDQICEERTMPQNSGDIVRMHVYTPKTTATVQALSALSEGTNPTASVVSASTVSAQILEYGDYWDVSSKFSTTALDDPIVNRYVDIAGDQAARHMDNLILAEVKNATTNVYSNAKTAVSLVAASDTFGIGLVRNAKRKLFNNYAMTFSDGNFRCVLSGDAEYDLTGDSLWLNAQYYKTQTGSQLLNNELGRYNGVTFMSSNNPSVENATGGVSSAPVYNAYFAGREAIGIIKPTGKEGNAMIIVKQSGAQDTSNPLNMYGTIGYKFVWAVKILNNNFLVEARHGVTYSS